ncbi:unnamed protein product [Dibothriocephalus latus]|uniref:Fibronectin type-III domain-containing protein n=1 Tax=Dibothriocephalus latus TaxID=60516 RepID=A0A3P7N5D9_DIBLA|nr:unnamed protein product [Dibothriocephalus latus]
MGLDPLIYVLQIMRVQHGNSDSSDKAVTVYRGAQTSYLLSGLSSGADYIARVYAIRLCQVPVENSDLVMSSSSYAKYNNCVTSSEDVKKELNVSWSPQLLNFNGSMQEWRNP